MVSEIIESRILNLNLQNPTSKIGLLHLLSKIKNKEIIDSILKNQKSLDPNIKDKHGNTAIHYAAYLRNDYYLENLIKFGANVNAVNKYGYNALHVSLFAYDDSKDHTPKIERILIRHGVNVNQIDEDLRIPIFYVFFKNKTPEEGDSGKIDPANLIITLLENDNIKINTADKLQCTPLHYACGVGATICALAMINKGANQNAKSVWGETPFATAVSSNRSELIILLIQ